MMHTHDGLAPERTTLLCPQPGVKERPCPELLGLTAESIAAWASVGWGGGLSVSGGVEERGNVCD